MIKLAHLSDTYPLALARPPPWDRSLILFVPLPVSLRATLPFPVSRRPAFGRVLPRVRRVTLRTRTTTVRRSTRATGRPHLTLERSCIVQSSPGSRR